jgi:hypothetical protein
MSDNSWRFFVSSGPQQTLSLHRDRSQTSIVKDGDHGATLSPDRVAWFANSIFERYNPSLPRRKASAVRKHPKPYLTLRLKLMDEASSL